MSDERKSSVRSSLEGVGREAAALARQATLIYRDVRGARPMWVGGGRDVVMLVHGLFATAGVLRPLRRELEARTGAFSTSFTHPPGPGIASIAHDIALAVRAISGDARIHLVGHSIGGVAVRYFVQELGGDVRVVQTMSIGSPFGGTRPARLFPAPVGRDIIPGSALLERLAQGARRRLVVPHLSIAGLEDHVVPSGAYLASGERVSVPGCGHNSLLYHPRVVAEVVERIARVQAAAAVRDARVAG
ncbi:MAG TPA: alpha/beta hydrolase [Polyangiaceae bacterium]